MLKRILNLEGTQKLSKTEQKNITGAGFPGVPLCLPDADQPGGSGYYNPPPAIKCPANNQYGYIWTCDAYCK